MARPRLRVLATALALLVLPLQALHAQEVGPGAEVHASRDDARDGDGVPETLDLCPTSPRSADPIWGGCAAVEILNRPEIVTAGPLASIDAMLAELQDARPLDRATGGLAKARDDIESSAALLGEGDVCKAARTYEHAESDLRRAGTEMEQGVDALAGVLLSFDPESEDASAGDITVAYLRMLAGRLGNAVDDGLGAGQTMDALCGAVTGRFEARGIITDVDDAAGLLTTDGGRVLGFDHGRWHDRFTEGLPVLIKGASFADGTGFAEKITSDEPDSFIDDVPLIPCMLLRIAPIQPFAPFHPGPSVLHAPQAYADPAGELQLEAGMRLAAVETGCPHSTPQGLSLRYAMEIEVIESLASSQVVAADFEDGDDPVSFPSFSALSGTIKTTVLIESCQQLANGVDKCSAPTEQLVRYHDEFLRPRGHYSTAVYSQKVFSVKDNKIADDFDTATAVAMDLTDVPVGTNAHFVGEGYAVDGNGDSSRPQVVEVDQGEPFAIYDQDDFIPEDGLFLLQTHGVTAESGLTWPRIVGTRNGLDFWYSSKLPKLLRDLVSICPDDPDSWYRLPFFGGWPAWVVNTGNADDPVHPHGSGQPYAWDIDADLNTDIAATRGGLVVWVVEDEFLNVKDYPKDPNDPTKVDPSYKKVGNFIWILHDDGTVSTYNHLIQWGALVDEGDIVHRGQHIAEVGNTGYSSHPHLHYEGNLGTVDWHTEKPSIVKGPVRFEAAVGEGDPFPTDWIEKDCYVPRVGDKLLSTQ